MKKGICKLCDLEKELKRSHVIGRAVFKKALNGANYALRLDKQHKKVIKDQDQWATYMLCGDCEHDLNTKYEGYSLDILRNKKKSVKHKKEIITMKFRVLIKKTNFIFNFYYMERN
ncbi:hypothetical protein [Acinetobacter baumannii]|uniref:hypothetical protein n=1 Tax=Acinetobacter baumannii TaxID=470 RepID=UPI001F08EBB4|nr:hypothetical protein [Acinetobacter baumannii]UMN10600.1 hypothetical protein L2Z49_06150 [Acinetobacter baumannii]UMN35297.1 hypothetical protein L2Z11_01245 [Acinetobacter baumannii]